MTQPAIIQGGMGAAVSGWRLARADGLDELPLVTAGDDLTHLAEFLPPGRDSYSAADVLRLLLPQPASETK